MRTISTALASVVITALVASAAGTAAASSQPHATATERFQEIAAGPASHQARVIVRPTFTVVSEHLNKTTCLLTQDLRVTYTISHGTGRYAGIRGSGHGTLSDLEITARNSHGTCTPGKAARAQQVVGRGHGPVTLR